MGHLSRLQSEVGAAPKIRQYLRCQGRFGMGLGYTLVGPNVGTALQQVPDALNICSLCPVKQDCWEAVSRRSGDNPDLRRRALKGNILYGFQVRQRDMVNNNGPLV